MSHEDEWSCLGTRGGHIEVVPWRAEWPLLFEKEAERIRAACGDAVVAVEHIGSTSVSGLASKPILDIMRGLGYEYYGEHGIPGRFYFDRKPHGASVIHVHMFEFRSPDWRRLIAFRDVLRRDPAVAEEYQRLKLDLAVRFRNDRKAYTEAKADFISSVLAKALP